MTPLERTIKIYQAIENPNWEGAFLFGSIKVDKELTSFVNDFADDLEIELENAQGKIINATQLDQYQHLQIKFLPPRKQFSFFAKNFDDYLAHFGFLYEPADEFYIANIQSHFKKEHYIKGHYNPTHDNNNIQQASNQHITAYCQIIELYQLLLKVADHTQKDEINTHRHIFLSVSGKDEIPVIYNSDDINHFSQDIQAQPIQHITEELLSAPHQSAKLTLFKKALSQFLSGHKDKDKFSSLIDHFPEVLKSYRNNYELFLNEFSFDDEREKLEKEKQTYILKLNDILNGIHGKLLAVPISLVLVAGEMKPSTVDNAFLINLIILFGAFIFALLMWMLTRNQLHSLIAVKTEYLAKKKRLKLELRTSLFDELSEAFDQLDERFMHQRFMIRFIDLIVLLGFFFSVFVFEYHTVYLASLL